MIYKKSQDEFRNIHNEAMDHLHFARAGYDPRDRDREYTETDKKRDMEKALELEKQAVALIQARYDQTQSDDDKLTETIYCRSAAWVAIQAGRFDEAEKIALTALARGAHLEDKANLLDAYFTALKKQGYRLQSFQEESTNIPIPNFVTSPMQTAEFAAH